MAWIALQLADVQSRVSAVEIVSVANASANPTGIVAEVIQTVTDLIRGYAANVTALGPEGTLPDKLIDCAKDIWAFKFLSSVPGKLSGPMYDSRYAAYKDALRLLRDVQEGKFRIEAPVQPAAEQPLIPLPTVSNCRARRDARWEAGLGGSGRGGPYYE
jgi:hypothetical protein